MPSKAQFLHLEILPLVLDMAHKLFKPILTADIFEQRIDLVEEEIVDKSPFCGFLNPVDRLLPLVDQGITFAHPDRQKLQPQCGLSEYP
jgi:hypothetical protein